MCEPGCDSKFDTKPCMCYANRLSLDIDNDQTCMYEDNGVLYPCDPKCCRSGAGCPGQCEDTKPNEPQALNPQAPMRYKAKDPRHQNINTVVTIVMWIFLWLAIVSTLSLFL